MTGSSSIFTIWDKISSLTEDGRGEYDQFPIERAEARTEAVAQWKQVVCVRAIVCMATISLIDTCKRHLLQTQLNRPHGHCWQIWDNVGERDTSVNLNLNWLLRTSGVDFLFLRGSLTNKPCGFLPVHLSAITNLPLQNQIGSTYAWIFAYCISMSAYICAFIFQRCLGMLGILTCAPLFLHTWWAKRCWFLLFNQFLWCIWPLCISASSYCSWSLPLSCWDLRNC